MAAFGGSGLLGLNYDSENEGRFAFGGGGGRVERANRLSAEVMNQNALDQRDTASVLREMKTKTAAASMDIFERESLEYVTEMTLIAALKHASELRRLLRRRYVGRGMNRDFRGNEHYEHVNTAVGAHRKEHEAYQALQADITREALAVPGTTMRPYVGLSASQGRRETGAEQEYANIGSRNEEALRLRSVTMIEGYPPELPNVCKKAYDEMKRLVAFLQSDQTVLIDTTLLDKYFIEINRLLAISKHNREAPLGMRNTEREIAFVRYAATCGELILALEGIKQPGRVALRKKVKAFCLNKLMGERMVSADSGMMALIGFQPTPAALLDAGVGALSFFSRGMETVGYATLNIPWTVHLLSSQIGQYIESGAASLFGRPVESETSSTTSSSTIAGPVRMLFNEVSGTISERIEFCMKLIEGGVHKSTRPAGNNSASNSSSIASISTISEAIDLERGRLQLMPSVQEKGVIERRIETLEALFEAVESSVGSTVVNGSPRSMNVLDALEADPFRPNSPEHEPFAALTPNSQESINLQHEGGRRRNAELRAIQSKRNAQAAREQELRNAARSRLPNSPTTSNNNRHNRKTKRPRGGKYTRRYKKRNSRR